MSATNDVRDAYARIVTADSLMLYAQGATDIYHAVLPFVTRTEEDNDRLTRELEAEREARIKAEDMLTYCDDRGLFIIIPNELDKLLDAIRSRQASQNHGGTK